MEEITLSQDEKSVIAEFIFSYQTDVLIKSDAIALVRLLYKCNILTAPQRVEYIGIINRQQRGISEILLNLVNQHFAKPQLDAIMAEYYGG
jgi:hypothetical protein